MKLITNIDSKQQEDLIIKYKSQSEVTNQDSKLIMLRKLKSINTEKKLLERKRKRKKTLEQRIKEFNGDLLNYEYKEWDTGESKGKEIW